MYAPRFWQTIYDFNSPKSNAMLQNSVYVTKRIVPYIELVKKYTPTNSNVYLIYQNSVGTEKIILSYSIWPSKVQL